LAVRTVNDAGCLLASQKDAVDWVTQGRRCRKIQMSKGQRAFRPLS
jgi:hypothetical protein